MSEILFFSTDVQLKKTEIAPHEIYDNLKYPDSLYVSDGILFDADLHKTDKEAIDTLLKEKTFM